MREQLEQRLQALKAEFESSQKMLVNLKTRQANLRETLLRISRAIQVLEELVAQEPQPSSNTTEPGDANSAGEAGTRNSPLWLPNPQSERGRIRDHKSAHRIPKMRGVKDGS